MTQILSQVLLSCDGPTQRRSIVQPQNKAETRGQGRLGDPRPSLHMLDDKHMSEEKSNEKNESQTMATSLSFRLPYPNPTNVHA